MNDNRTTNDLSDEELEDLENNPDDWQDVIENTIQSGLSTCFPNEEDLDEYMNG